MNHYHFAHIADYFWRQCVENSITQYDIDDWTKLAKRFEEASGYYDYQEEYTHGDA